MPVHVQPLLSVTSPRVCPLRSSSSASACLGSSWQGCFAGPLGHQWCPPELGVRIGQLDLPQESEQVPDRPTSLHGANCGFQGKGCGSEGTSGVAGALWMWN